MKNIYFLFIFIFGLSIPFLNNFYSGSKRLGRFYEKYYPEDPTFQKYIHSYLSAKDEEKIEENFQKKYGRYEDQKQVIERLLKSKKVDISLLNSIPYSDLLYAILREVHFTKSKFNNRTEVAINLAQKFLTNLSKLRKYQVERYLFADYHPERSLYSKHYNEMYPFDSKDIHDKIENIKSDFFRTQRNFDYTDDDVKKIISICSKVKFYDRINIFDIEKGRFDDKKIMKEVNKDCESRIVLIKPYLNKSIINDFIIFFEKGGYDAYAYINGQSFYVYAKSKRVALPDKLIQKSDKSLVNRMLAMSFISLDKDIDRMLRIYVLRNLLDINLRLNEERF